MKSYAIHGIPHPTTGIPVYALYIQLKSLQWQTVYISDSYDRAGVLNCLDYLLHKVDDARDVMCGGYIYSATPSGLVQLVADLPTT